jgi:uncharacterized protein
VETNLPFIARAVTDKESENTRFKEFLKSIPTRQVDTVVARINQHVSSAIDCTQCGNCCKELEPPVNNQEITRLAARKDLSVNDFTVKFVATETTTGIQFLRSQPCIFLTENKCGVYHQRPSSCADYPHITQPNFKYRWRSVMRNYSLCPIVFNVVERLKQELHFQ